MDILVTGGAGYIGTHTLIELIESGYKPHVLDNLSNSSSEALNRVEKITGTKVPFYEFDLQNRDRLEELFLKHNFSAVIHFAALKSVGESVKHPLSYYLNNVGATISLLDVCQKHNVNKFIFSSSATVYGNPEELPLKESSRTGVGITNPYGQTKFMIEQILKDISHADPAFEVTILRYFNPIGAHPSGLIGEDPNDIPNNILPYISQVAIGKLDKVKIFGNDYETTDGTGVRDYIHVVDLAKGHVAALKHLNAGIKIYNLGTGEGVSVLQLIHAFSEASKKDIPYEFTERREGDIASCIADASKANQELEWFTSKTIAEACEDAWRWQSKNPNGYK